MVISSVVVDEHLRVSIFKVEWLARGASLSQLICMCHFSPDATANEFLNAKELAD
jgi:hypothetical protein